MNWWKKLQNWSEEMSKKYGVSVEIHYAEKVGEDEFSIKLGIYPWGVVIIDGDLEYLERFIENIAYEIGQQYKCPFCGKMLSLKEIYEKHKCSCGAKIIVASSKSLSEIHDNSAFEVIEKHLTPAEREKVRFFIFENNFFIEDVFKNVKFSLVKGYPTYWLKGEKPILRNEKEIEQIRPVEIKLIREGYEFVEAEGRECALFENDEEHQIGIVYDNFEPGKPAKYYQIWIEVKSPLTPEEENVLEGENDYLKEIEKLLNVESIQFQLKYECFNALPVKAEEFLKADLKELKKELQNKFSSAQLKMAEKFNLHSD